MKKLFCAVAVLALFASPVIAEDRCPGQMTVETVNAAYPSPDVLFLLRADKTPAFITAFSALAKEPIDANTVEIFADVPNKVFKVMLFKDGCTIAHGAAEVDIPTFKSLAETGGIQMSDFAILNGGSAI